MMTIQSMINHLSWLYVQFQLITMTYLMDPYEWWCFHSVLLIVFMVLTYVFYVIVPTLIHQILECIDFLVQVVGCCENQLLHWMECGSDLVGQDSLSAYVKPSLHVACGLLDLCEIPLKSNTVPGTIPLQQLFSQDIEFQWLRENEKAFAELKKLFIKRPVLKYYGVNKDVSVDARSAGIVAVWLQDDFPVGDAYVSAKASVVMALFECLFKWKKAAVLRQCPRKGVMKMTYLQDIITGYRMNFEKQGLMAVTFMKYIKGLFYWIYQTYIFTFCCLDLDLWERMIIHIFCTTVFTMMAFTAYMFIPIHLRLASQFFLQLLK